MKKSQLRNRIILYATIGVITVGLVILILLLVPSKEKTADASMQVAFGSLSSNLSSTGTVNKVTAKQDIPLALFIDEEDRDFFEKLTDSEKISLDLFLEAESRNVALFYHVKEVNEAFAEESLQLSTADEEQTILTLVPLRVRWELIPHADIDISDRAGKRSALFSLLKLDEVGIEVFGAYLDEYLEEDTAEELRITNTLLAEKFVKKQITYSDTVEYGVSAVKVAEGDRILPSEVLTKISISEWMTAFRLSEYDVRYIHERMLNDERVYAAVGVNALNGQRVLAEITKIGSANVSSGISYFTISARLIFPRITFIEPEEEDGKPTEKGDFSYYDEFLDDTTVKYLGVDLSDNLEKDELLDGYSVTITAQKTVITDTLIIATKCIYYDDAKNPYVIRIGTDNKEERVYIKITQSTGTDAAVTAAEGYQLSKGDALRYTSDSSLLQSLF